MVNGCRARRFSMCRMAGMLLSYPAFSIIDTPVIPGMSQASCPTIRLVAALHLCNPSVTFGAGSLAGTGPPLRASPISPDRGVSFTKGSFFHSKTRQHFPSLFNIQCSIFNTQYSPIIHHKPSDPFASIIAFARPYDCRCV